MREAGEIEKAIDAFQNGAALVAPYAERYPGSPIEELFHKLVRNAEHIKKMLSK